MMFSKARFKLTVWYLLIIMLISTGFSGVIYKVLTAELDRFSHMQRLRIESRVRSIQPRIFVDPDLAEETKQRLIVFLLIINSGILFVSGILAYFLAGKTLRPIKEMVDEQNRFISDASHELRTPLTALKSETEVTLRSKDLNFKEAKNQLASNLEEIDKLQVLSDSLIKLTAYQKTNNNSKFVKTSIFQISSEAVKKVLPLAKQKGIRIENNIKNISIEVERNTFGELFVILLDNA